MLTFWPARRRCPICGAAGHDCGGPTEIVPVDQRLESHMAERQNLTSVEVTLPGGLKTKFRVTPDKAERYKKMSKQADKSGGSQPAQPPTKARTPHTHSGDVETK